MGFSFPQTVASDQTELKTEETEKLGFAARLVRPKEPLK
jgi:hypothetical protein